MKKNFYLKSFMDIYTETVCPNDSPLELIIKSRGDCDGAHNKAGIGASPNFFRAFTATFIFLLRFIFRLTIKQV
jgi:hypothetical protein